MNDLEYAVVIATRNRPEALRLSIPRMLAQSRRPSQLIIVDSSDDPDATRGAVIEAVGDDSIDFTLLRSARGASLQRNIGLRLVKHPVTFFPDDDSIWFPDTAAKMMAVYEQDEAGSIAAVCGAESKVPPSGFPAKGGEYEMRRSDRIKQRIGFRRSRLEARVAPDPAKVLGNEFRTRFERRPWHVERDVVPVEWMTGFRMSFRTEVIRAVRFDEIFTAYSLFEDIDASFGAWSHGAVVGVRDARVFHYKSPERRGDGRRMGAIQLLNKAYVVAKHTQPGHAARRSIRRFSAWKQVQYLTAVGSRFGRDRLAGALAARQAVRALADSTPESARAIYQEAAGEILIKREPTFS